MEFMTEIGPFVASPKTILTFICVLIVWAAWSGYNLWVGSKTLLAAIDAATKEIVAAEKIVAKEDAAGFAVRYETVSQDLSGNPILGARWKEYKQTFLIPEQGLIRATARADNWFDMSLLRAPGIGIDLRYHAALPGLLVGAGLLFTFLGLAIALENAGGIVAPNVDQDGRNKALHDLLRAAGLKFWTSVAGLFLSICYALFRKWWLREVELARDAFQSALDAFQSALDERTPLITPVLLQHETNKLLGSQATVLETFSNDLAVSLGERFDNAFDKRLGEHIGPLTDAMTKLSDATTKLSDNLTSGNKDAMQDMVASFIEQLRGSSSDQMAVVAEKLASLGAGLEGLQTGMRDAATRMAESADAMARRMGEGAEAAMAGVTNQMTALVETFRALAEQSRSAGADAGHELAARLEAAAGGFERSAQTVATTLAEAARGLEQRMGNQAEDSTRRLAEQFDAMIETLRSLAENSRSMGANALDAVAARIDTAAATFQGVSERVASALEEAARQTGGAFDRGASDAVERIVAATEGMRSELQAMLTGVRASLGEAGNAIADSGKAGAAAMRDSLDKAGADLAESMNGAAANLRQSGETASAALRQGGADAGGRIETAGTNIAGRAEGLSRQIAGLAETSALLATRIGALNLATGETARPLTQAAEQLRLVSEGMRGAVAPLADITRRAGGLLEQVGAIAQGLDTAQSGSIRLTDSLDKATSRLTDSLDEAILHLTDSLDQATSRYEGVDKSLAGVFNELQDGITRFCKDVTRFVSQTDSNLEKAATHVQNMVKSLDDSIEELSVALKQPRR